MATRYQLKRVGLVLACAGLVLATGTTRVGAQPTMQGVVFGGAGSTFDANTVHLGGGVEVIWPQGIGVSAEIGYLTLARHFADGVGVLGVGGFYYLPVGSAASRVRPFAVGGYGAAFREGYVNLWNAGGGIDYSIGHGKALRVEFRDYFDVADGEVRGSWAVRAGVVFR